MKYAIPPILQTLWNEVKFKPNQKQLEAILYVDGPLFLTAGAGSGKTRVLLWRTLNLIVHHEIAPEDIVLTTFTEKAAQQLKEGLRTYLGFATNHTKKPYDISKMYIGTVHSICQEILQDRRKFSDGRRIERFQILDALQQYFYVKSKKVWPILLETADITELEIQQIFTPGSEYANKHKSISYAISLFNRFSEEELDPEPLIQGDNTNPAERKILVMYKKYIELLNEGGIARCDFSLLQQKALQLLRQNDKSKMAFKHVIVDEYQDTNPIQEKIFFHLAQGYHNICVVGDDDQALYRFRGATVENFVEFPKRAMNYLNRSAHQISLNINYRSRKEIVQFSVDFMETQDWLKEGTTNEYYRVHNKQITAHSQDNNTSVITTTSDGKEQPEEIAAFVKELIDTGKVDDPNQIAFLFYSLGTQFVQRMKTALEDVGLKVYAPRAGSFLEVPECVEIFGVFFKVFGKPTTEYSGYQINPFKNWIDRALAAADAIIEDDSALARYIEDRKAELARSQADYEVLLEAVEASDFDLEANYMPSEMKRTLLNAKGLSKEGYKVINNPYFDGIVEKRLNGEGQTDEPPFSLLNVIIRSTSVDWSILDLFYQLCGFEHFANYFDLAERQEDEAPICNLGLITQYLSQFMELYGNVLTARFTSEDVFLGVFSWGYLYSLWRLGESEYEDEEDPFPKGRIPFITIHQSKGLEFPVVYLHAHKTNRKNKIEEIMRRLKPKQAEPLELVGTFDSMRLFYVGASRAENLLIVGHPKANRSAHKGIKDMIGKGFPDIAGLQRNTLPTAKSVVKDKLVKPYSYTSDYLLYDRCPRQYMIFRKYGFVPSRSQTMFFGSLVHETIEDLHHYLIQARKEQEDEN